MRSGCDPVHPDNTAHLTWQVPLFFLMMGVVLFAGVLFYTEKGGARQEDFKDMWHFEVLLPARWETAWARCSAVSSAPSVQGGFRAPVAV